VLCVVYIHLTSRFIVRYALNRVIVADGLSKTPSGTPGLDDVLHGGVPAGRATVVSGGHGTGKTVLALQFLAAGDDGLSVGFEEREQELRRNASALGIDLSNVSILDLSPTGEQFFSDDSYTVFPTEEVDGEDLLDRIASELEASEIDRLVVDPLSELRSLLPDDFQFRRRIPSLFNALTDRDVTTVCTAQPAAEWSERRRRMPGDRPRQYGSFIKYYELLYSNMLRDTTISHDDPVKVVQIDPEAH